MVTVNDIIGGIHDQYRTITITDMLDTFEIPVKCARAKYGNRLVNKSSVGPLFDLRSQCMYEIKLANLYKNTDGSGLLIQVVKRTVKKALLNYNRKNCIRIVHLSDDESKWITNVMDVQSSIDEYGDMLVNGFYDGESYNDYTPTIVIYGKEDGKSQ